MLVVAVLAIFPLVPRHISNRAYRLSFLGTGCSSLYSLYSLYGVTLLLTLGFPFCACSRYIANGDYWLSLYVNCMFLFGQLY